MITPSSNIPVVWIKFPNLFPFCVILDFNKLLGDYYFQNLVLSCLIPHKPSLCCHIFHLSLPPWLLRKTLINSTKILQHLPFSLLSLAILQLFPAIAEAQVMAFRSSGIQPTGMKEYQEPPRGKRGFKIGQHLSFATWSGFWDKKWTWLSPYFSDVVLGMKKREWIIILFKWFIWQILVVAPIRRGEKLRMTQVSGLGNWVDTGSSSFILNVAMTSY